MPVSPLVQRFAERRAEGHTCLITFLVAGHPDLRVTERAVLAMGEAGAAIVEIGFPFTDPIADGPVIASAMHEALQGGIVPAHIFDMVRRIRDHGIAPGLVAMLSHSIVSRIGRDAFLDEAADSGFEGLLIPDLDPVEAEALADAAGARGLATAFLVAQTTTPDRLEHYARLVERTGGFLYLLARAGITGERDEAPDVAEAVARMRAVTTAPLAVGFGISSARHVAAVTASADAAVVGSALVRRMGAADDPVAEAAAFTGALVEGLAPATS